MDPIRAEQDGPILRLTIVPPDRFNALSTGMLEELLRYLVMGEDDRFTRVVVINAEGASFGGDEDQRQLAEFRDNKDLAGFSAFLTAANALVAKLHNCSKPTIVAVHAPAYDGGANLALACDLRVGSTGCSFSQRLMRHGLGPAWGSSHRLAHLIGADRAKELLFTARTIEAREALSLGLLHQVVDPTLLRSTATRLAQDLAECPPIAISLAKRTLALAPSTTLERALELEHSAAMRGFLSEELA